MTEPHTEPRSTPWGWIVLIWSSVGLIDACQTVLFVHSLGQQHPWLPVFGTELASWLPWVLATPFISGLARRYPPVRGTVLRTFAVHLAAFAAISVVAQAWYVWLQMAFNPWNYPQQPTFSMHGALRYPIKSQHSLIVYGLILTVTLIMDARDSMARQITEAARLNEELSQAQLAALRRQSRAAFHVQYAERHRRARARP